MIWKDRVRNYAGNLYFMITELRIACLARKGIKERYEYECGYLQAIDDIKYIMETGKIPNDKT